MFRRRSFGDRYRQRRCNRFLESTASGSSTLIPSAPARRPVIVASPDHIQPPFYPNMNVIVDAVTGRAILAEEARIHWEKPRNLR